MKYATLVLALLVCACDGTAPAPSTVVDAGLRSYMGAEVLDTRDASTPAPIGVPAPVWDAG